MYKGKTIAVVVPAYNEETLISRVIETMPPLVDRIIVVDDKSSDRTADITKEYVTKLAGRVILHCHEKNQGVGGAITTGYRIARDAKMDITAVMAGDAQMDPSDLEALLDPVVDGAADYSKGNRLVSGEAWKTIPRARYLGNAALSFLTKIASGYWHVADSQTGYTAASLKVLQTIPLETIYRRYGMPNDLLVRLNVYNFRVIDVPIRPVYGIGEKSGINLPLAVPRFTCLLTKLFFWRMKEKYIIRDFHPLIFFYLTGLLCAPTGIIFGLYLVIRRIIYHPVAATSALFAAFLLLFGLQSLFFGMWMDMEYNRKCGPSGRYES